MPRSNFRAALFCSAALVYSSISVTPCNAFLATGHFDITDQALSGISKTVNGKTYKFTKDAIIQIQTSNALVDLFYMSDSSRHFDSENLAGSSAFLQSQKQKILSLAAVPGEASEARDALGEALHTLQDFYSHSNVSETGRTVEDMLMGNSTFAPLPITVKTCEAGSNFPPRIAGSVLTGAGLDPGATPTTGYYGVPTPVDTATTAQKCAHGAPFTPLVGINKDNILRAGYGAASSRAQESTRKFVQSILDDPQISSNEDAIRALMGIYGDLGLVIDTTGSMGSIIDQVKAQATEIVNGVAGTEDEPANYVLEPFNDPSVGPPTVTSKSSVVLAAIGALTANGGGDCPELQNTGLLEAISVSSDHSELYLFTDASAKDDNLAGQVIEAAKKKNITINYLNFGTCSSGFGLSAIATPTFVPDPTYGEIAKATGGQLFVLNRDEAGASANLIRAHFAGIRPSAIALSDGASSGSAQTFSIPVDSTLGSVSISLSVDSLTSAALTRPSGSVVQSSDPNVHLSSLSDGLIANIKSPEPGVWKLTFTGSGPYSLKAQGGASVANDSTLIQTPTFTLVQLGGRPDHPGYFQISGQPIAGVNQLARAVVKGAYKTAVFSLVDETGAALQTINLATGDFLAPTDFIGSFVVPTVPFRLQVSGTDSRNVQYQRIATPLYTASTVSVVPEYKTRVLVAGARTTLTYNVTNVAGAKDTFQLSANDSQGYPASAAPASVVLGQGETANVSVTVDTPAGAKIGARVDVSVTATSATNASLSNIGVDTLHVAATTDTKAPNIALTATTTAMRRSDDTTVTLKGTVTNGGSGVDFKSGVYAIRQKNTLIEQNGPFQIASDGAFRFTIRLDDHDHRDPGHGHDHDHDHDHDHGSNSAINAVSGEPDYTITVAVADATDKWLGYGTTRVMLPAPSRTGDLHKPSHPQWRLKGRRGASENR